MEPLKELSPIRRILLFGGRRIPQERLKGEQVEENYIRVRFADFVRSAPALNTPAMDISPSPAMSFLSASPRSLW